MRVQDQSFNPRPSFLTGESGGGEGAKGVAGCFNPRPSFLTGESLEGGFMGDYAEVSIHARHF